MQRNQGFTLIETLIAITILTVSIAGPLVIASKGLSASIHARDQITAFYLAQEALEFVRNERDSSGLRARTAAPTFTERFAECASGPCTVDIRTSGVETCDGGECPPLRFDEATGLYSYISGDPSPFTRSVELEEVNDSEVTLTVTMDWTSGLLNRSFSIRSDLLEWFGEAGGVLGSGGSSSGGSSSGGGISIGGLIAHYRADDYTAGSWSDRTGNGFDLSQSTGANQPSAISDGGFTFNNQPVVRFDGANDFLKNTAISVSQPSTIVVIGKADAGTGAAQFYTDGGTSSTRQAVYYDNPPSQEKTSIYAGSSDVRGASSPGSTEIVEGYFNGANSSVRRNGIVEATGNAGSQPLDGLTVGARYDGGAWFLSGDVAEILIYDGPLSNDERQDLADYAATRYGVGQTDLVAHYRADDYTAGNWPDRTGNGFNLSQGTAANQPTAVADGGFEFGNQPVVRFDGSDDFLERASTPSLPQPHTKVIIAKTVADSSNSKFVVGSIDDSARGDIFFNSNEQVQTYAGSGLTGTDSHLNQVVLAEALFDGSSSAIRVNGAVESIGDAGSQTSIGLRVGLPSYDAVSQAFDGDIAEILIYDGPLSESERQDLADYAATRYGVGQTDLVAHYRADDYTAGNWPDRTGNGFNLSQGTAANQPTAVADGGFEFGNQPVVRFDGSNDFMQNIGLTLPQPHTAVIIAKTTQNTGTNQYPLFSKSGGPHSWIGFNSSEALFTYAGTTLNSGSGSMLNSTDLIEAFYNGSNSSIRRNGTLLITGNAGTQSRGDIIVGAQSTGANYWGGDLAEILIYDGELTSAQRQELSDYVADRYGIGKTDLVAHYRADDYTAGNWPDRTGNGFDLTQSTSANQPTAVADGGFEFGGQPVVRFDGVNDFLKDTSLTLSQPLTYVVIQKLTLDNSTTKTIVDGTTASNRAALAFLSNEAPVIYGGAQLDGSGSLHNVSTLIEAFYDGTSSSLRVDGELNVSGNAGTLTSAGLTVGTYYDTDANWYAGDVADILIYDGPLSADERQDLLDYAAERYGVNQILLLAGDTGNEVAAFTKSGDILLAGTLTQNGTPAATSDDELVFKDGNGDTVALLNTVTGDMLIAGSLFANQQTLAPSSASDDFVMQDDDGTVVIYFDDSGNLYLKGDVEENASF